MASTTGNYPAKYLQFNKQLSKQLAIVMTIEGVSQIFGISDTFEQITYGTQGLLYGLPGLVYGGLKKVGGPNGVGGIAPYIVLDGQMTIQQKIEPEQGKGNIGTLTMTLIDYKGQVSKIITPGIVVPEIMNSKQVKIYIGFQQTSFPVDYVLLYSGYITSLDCPPGLVKFQISDSTMKSRQSVFSTPTTVLSAPIDNAVTLIPVGSTNGFYSQILGPDGIFDPIVSTYLVIDSEFMVYGVTGITDPTDFTVTRGAQGTLPDSHDAGTSIANSIQLGDPNTVGENFITLALKLLLSGFGGPCETGISLSSLTYQLIVSPFTFVQNAIVLGSNPDTGHPWDALKDLGLTVGDYYYVTGATDPANNITGLITGFDELNGFNSIIYIDQNFNSQENPTTALLDLRSKYDTLPILAGSSCRMRDVDVATMEMVRDTYFNSGIYNISVYYDQPVFAKDIIASDLFLPMGCYQISRYGRISVSVTKPPLPGVGKLIQLDYTNVISPDQIHVTRSTNTRTFYNQISFQYDFNPGTGNYETTQYFVDTNSLNAFDQVMTLPIVAPGLKTSLGGGDVATIRGEALLNRYKNIALQLSLTVNWSVGSLIEVSDVVILVDNGNLKIMNFQTGERNLGIQLFEVIDRTYDVTSGNVKLVLLGGVGFDVDSRFGLIAPSTIMNVGCTSTLLRLTPSFGQTVITNEVAKWSMFNGLPIRVHSPDYSVDGSSVLVGINGFDPSALDVLPALPFTPQPGYILEIAPYPTDTDKTENQLYKNLYTYITPTIAITSGVSNTSFHVSSGDVGNLTVGNPIVIRKANFDENPQGNIFTSEIQILSIVGTLVTVKSTFGFTPDNTYVVEGIGFKDGTGYYRYG